MGEEEDKVAAAKAEEEKKTAAESLVNKTNEASERLEKANAESQAVEAKLKAERLLGGQAEAGTPVVKPEPESDKDYAKRVIEGNVGN